MIIENNDEVLKLALNYRAEIAQAGSFFVFRYNLYRGFERETKDNIKNICWFFPEYLKYELKPSLLDDVAHYIFKINYSVGKEAKIIKISPQKLASKRGFNTAIISSGFFLKFAGSQSDFDSYLSYCFEGGKPFVINEEVPSLA